MESRWQAEMIATLLDRPGSPAFDSGTGAATVEPSEMPWRTQRLALGEARLCEEVYSP
jgi:hypothetical protein